MKSKFGKCLKEDELCELSSGCRNQCLFHQRWSDAPLIVNEKYLEIYLDVICLKMHDITGNVMLSNILRI